MRGQAGAGGDGGSARTKADMKRAAESAYRRLIVAASSMAPIYQPYTYTPIIPPQISRRT